MESLLFSLTLHQVPADDLKIHCWHSSTPNNSKTFIFHATILHTEHIEGLTRIMEGTRCTFIYVRRRRTICCPLWLLRDAHTLCKLYSFIFIYAGRPVTSACLDVLLHAASGCTRQSIEEMETLLVCSQWKGNFLETRHCYALPIVMISLLDTNTHTHTHTHTHSQASSNLSNVFVKLPLSQALNPTCCRSRSL